MLHGALALCCAAVCSLAAYGQTAAPAASPASTPAPATARPATRRGSPPAQSNAAGQTAGASSATGVQAATGAAVVAKRSRTRVPKAGQPGYNFNLIVLDPGHGGPDKGGDFGSNLLEKNVNLAFAKKLRGVLQGRGFTVALTRENDPAYQPPAPAPQEDSTDQPPPAPPPVPVSLSADARAEAANRGHAVACLVLHTTASGHGVHVYTSALAPAPAAQVGPDKPITPWDTAQTAFLPQSTAMATDLTQALDGLRIPMVSGRASIGPMDFLTCPVAALELAPMAVSRETTTPPSDEAYQQRIAEALADGLTRWRDRAQAAAQALDAAANATTPEKTPKPKTRAKPKTAQPASQPAAPPTTQPGGAR